MEIDWEYFRHAQEETRKPTGIKAECPGRVALHLETGMVGEWAELFEGAGIGNFTARGGSIFTAIRGEVRVEGEPLTAADEIEIEIQGIPHRIGGNPVEVSCEPPRTYWDHARENLAKKRAAGKT